MIAGLHNHSFPHHVPELLLRYPVFLAVVAYDQGSFFDFHIRPTVSHPLRLNTCALWMEFVSLICRSFNLRFCDLPPGDFDGTGTVVSADDGSRVVGA